MLRHSSHRMTRFLAGPELVAELDSARAAVAVARAENAARGMSQESQRLAALRRRG
jgi:hypothetical protein